MNAVNMVFYMGVAFVLLAIFKLFGVDIEPAYLFCVSISALIFLIHDYWEFMNKSLTVLKGKNIKRSMIHQPLARLFLNKKASEQLTYLAMITIIVVPHIPFVKNVPKEVISRWSDFMTLFALGLTIALIGIKQSKADAEEISDYIIPIDEKNCLDEEHVKNER